MVTEGVLKRYEMTIGIECHVQLKTKTKLFAGVGNDAREAEPNSLISPICLGLPGTLPVLNREAVRLAIRAGHALNADIATLSMFDRKHYFYPDLPKGYQITQYQFPTVGKGYIDVPFDGQLQRVRITRAHLEEDAGKSTHPDGADYSLVDLNRAGTPLLEIVSEPDINSAGLAKAYARELYLLMKHAAVSDVDLYHGNMRFDVNVSVAPKDSKVLGTRAEVKNLNSFRSVEKAVEYEFQRQVELLEKGQAVVQETRGWDDAKMKTFSQRSKEEAHDYRYFPDPDLPPVHITKAEIDEIKAGLPPLPPAIRTALSDAGVDESQIEILLNSEQFLDIALIALDEANGPGLKRIVNWLVVDVAALTGEGRDQSSVHLTYSMLSSLSELVEAGDLSSSAAKQVLKHLLEHGGEPRATAQELNLIQVSDESELEAMVDAVIAGNQEAANDVRNGELKAIGFLVGKVMQASKGQANPAVVNKLLQKKLGGK